MGANGVTVVLATVHSCGREHLSWPDVAFAAVMCLFAIVAWKVMQ